MQNAPRKQAHPAEVAQEFMRRADLKGGEVDVYAQTYNWLSEFTTGELQAIPKDVVDKQNDTITKLTQEIEDLLEVGGVL